MAATLRLPGLRTLTLALPVVFVLHVLEEAPLFVSWFNRHVTPGISQPLFLAMNGWALGITLVVVGLLLAGPNPVSGVVAVAWVALLMLANGTFHLVATIVHGEYCPGVVTGTLIYLPMAIAFMRAVSRELHVPVSVIAASALVGSLPMAVHGYLIVFRGSRLF
ncbi:MAG TPA: HXXEE domain-containing protein [Thermoanaerobaculia bacterium]|nr:HXXEE domain-containing protein [Thermoanaerobaculia bacterium]